MMFGNNVLPKNCIVCLMMKVGCNGMIPFYKAITSLKKEKLAPIYVLLGTEYYFIESFKTAFLQQIGDDRETVNYYDLREHAIQDVIIDLETLPFFSEHNFSLVEHPFFLRATNEKVPIKHDVTSLEKYIENPAPYSTLILIAPYERLDRRKKITKRLLDQATVVDCQPIRGYELRKWLDEMIASHEITMTEEAKLRFEAEFGPNLYLLQKEIEKIAQYVGDAGEVTEEKLLEIMSGSMEQTAIELTDAVLLHDLKKAITIYKQLEKMNENPIGMIALLAYQFRMILQVKLLVEKGYPLQRIQSEVKAHPFVVKKAFERSRQYNLQSLYYVINELTETDYRIKSGQMEKEIAFELLLYRLINTSAV